jgi:SWI/SNF-related matrix-associated actin-dependent regulator of chromatin subfamily A member 5
MPKPKAKLIETDIAPPTAQKRWRADGRPAIENAKVSVNSSLAAIKKKNTATEVATKSTKANQSIQEKRVNLQDLSISSDLCMASFSRHVNLLEPFIDRSVIEVMRMLPTKRGYEKENIDVPQPSSICGTMRPYQILGLNWLIQQHKKSIGSILADEMGLGKTVQTISFIAHLLSTHERPSPHLIIVPLSVLSNWENEFKKFCPSIRVKRVHIYSGKEAERIFREIQAPTCPYDVIITTYEVIRCKFWSYRFSRILWHSLVLDEGHRIKNELTEAAHTCSLLRARFRLILTGTPIQNNMHESWALLNFLNPRVFTESKTFDDAFQSNSRNPNGIQSSPELMYKCHQIFRLMVLRRLKSEVELTLPAKLETLINCPLSEMQIFFTQRLLLRSSSIIKRMEESRVSSGQNAGDMKKLQSLAMQLRKAANHPYLFEGAEDPELQGATTDEIVTSSGKMIWLDALLTQLLQKGHRVVVFSQFTRILDIICDYLNMKNIRHSRLDGQTNPVLRQVIIDQFNRAGSRENVLVASTRAGGEGINLQSADTVILYDSDWYIAAITFANRTTQTFLRNPQKDIQAIGRVHRIGQQRTVHIYRLVTAGSVEERILQRQQQKLYLDCCVTRGSTALAHAIDAEQLVDDDNDTSDPETKEPALKFSAVMEVILMFPAA